MNTASSSYQNGAGGSGPNGGGASYASGYSTASTIGYDGSGGGQYWVYAYITSYSSAGNNGYILLKNFHYK